VAAAHRAGTKVSITARIDPAMKKAIGTIPEHGWTTIKYTDATCDEQSGTWTSSAELVEAPFLAFGSKKEVDRIEGRLVVRYIPELNRKDLSQPTLFDTHRFHAFFATRDLDTVTVDKTHRAHAVIEQVNAGREYSALAHLPSGKFAAHAARLVLACIAFQPLPRHRHHPPQTHHHPRANLHLGATTHPAPATGLALGETLGHLLRGGPRTTRAGDI
jgi:hypothetical protein